MSNQDVLQKFIVKAPFAVMTRIVTQAVIAEELDQVFEQHRELQYEKNVKFSTVAMAVAAVGGALARPDAVLFEPLGNAVDGSRAAVLAGPRPIGALAVQRFRTLCAIVRQGFELCRARERPVEPAAVGTDSSLEPLLPGFVCASAAMAHVSEQIQRLQGNDLTVLILQFIAGLRRSASLFE